MNSAFSAEPAPRSPIPAGGAASVATRKLTVALIGNPNTGKSTLFNALAGMNARVGNYPGVTVEKKIGQFRAGEQTVQVVDLPGTYSLSPRSADEMVSVRVILGTQPDLGPIDAVICIVDATHLQRNFYLLSQLLDLGRPTILVLNMWDEVESQGLKIDVAKLEQRLGIPVVPVCARKNMGVETVKTRLLELTAAAPSETAAPRLELFPEAFQTAREEIRQEFTEQTGQPLAPFLAERLLLDIHGQTEQELLKNSPLNDSLSAARQRLGEQNCPIPAIEPRVRYAWAREMLQDVVVQPAQPYQSAAGKWDRWLTHRIVGPIIFTVVMLVMFQSIFTWAGPLMGGIETLQGMAADVIIGAMPPGALRSLLVDGVISGVGAVVVFLPQIAILFLFMAVLEDCGYMSRAAYLMDRVMTKVGLSGKSFVPLMSSYACAIPGIMATRTIEDRKDRMVTILVAPLMSCSARLPVYLLMINAFVPDIRYAGGWLKLHVLVLLGFYLLGAVVAVPVAWLLKKVWFRGEPTPLVMELPAFKWPSLRVVFYRVWDRVQAFITQAGTLIFLTTVLVWGAGYFPGDHSPLNALDTRLESTEVEEESPEREALLEERRALAADLLNASFLGIAGHAIEPAVRPLGWDWRIGMAVMASFPAREVVIGTLGTIFSLGGDVDEDDPGLMDRLQSARRSDGTPLFNVPVALSVMVFFALCAQCGATLMVMRRETNSWTMPVVAFCYMTALAYLGALTVYQVGMLVL